MVDLQDLGFGVDGVPREDGGRQAHVFPAQFATALRETSSTDSPVTTARVSVDTTSGLPNFVRDA